VHLHYGEDLELTVVDDGRGAAAGLAEPAAPGAGRGNTGMRERAAMLGGRFTAGPRAGGGYQVHATLPCQRDSGPAVPVQRESGPH
jgi:signal transduction histidine kinase